jgi:hypothetical protein
LFVSSYLPQGEPVTDEDLLDGVSAADENGNPVEVTVAVPDDLDRDNPQPKGEPGDPQPYKIIYTCEWWQTATRDCFVTVGFVALAGETEITATMLAEKSYQLDPGNYIVNDEVIAERRIIINDVVTLTLTDTLSLSLLCLSVLSLHFDFKNHMCFFIPSCC